MSDNPNDYNTGLMYGGSGEFINPLSDTSPETMPLTTETPRPHFTATFLVDTGRVDLDGNRLHAKATKVVRDLDRAGYSFEEVQEIMRAAVWLATQH